MPTASTSRSSAATSSAGSGRCASFPWSAVDPGVLGWRRAGAADARAALHGGRTREGRHGAGAAEGADRPGGAGARDRGARGARGGGRGGGGGAGGRRRGLLGPQPRAGGGERGAPLSVFR